MIYENTALIKNKFWTTYLEKVGRFLFICEKLWVIGQ